jgi:hypothetical protein
MEAGVDGAWWWWCGLALRESRSAAAARLSTSGLLPATTYESCGDDAAAPEAMRCAGSTKLYAASPGAERSSRASASAAALACAAGMPAMSRAEAAMSEITWSTSPLEAMSAIEPLRPPLR